MRSHHHRSLRSFLLASAFMLAAVPAVAADVTSERLVNPEPGNWLMNHRTYDAQRYSPLERINKDNVKNLRLAYAVALGGTSANENLEATPLAEDGFLYVVDQWGVVYRIDGRSGDTGRIVWRMDPGQEKVPSANRGVALWGNLVISVANFPARVIATNKETGKVAWEANLSDGQADLAAYRSTAGDQGQDRDRRRRRRPRRAGFHRGARRRDRQAAVEKIHGPGPRRARLGDMEGQEQRVADRRRRHVGHGLLRCRHQPGAVGHRQSGADVQSVLSPRRQSLHQQPDFLGSRHRAR